MKHYLFLILCLFSSVVSAQPQKESTGNFEFGQVSGPCIEKACTLVLKKKYNDPLVFLMPSFSDKSDNLEIIKNEIEDLKNKVNIYCSWNELWKPWKPWKLCEINKNNLKKKKSELYNSTWNDAPSTLRIISINKINSHDVTVKFRQYFAPYTSDTYNNGLKLKSIGKCKGETWCIEKKPMRNISYFVIDNGSDINLGSQGRIIARQETVNKYIKYKDDIFGESNFVNSNLNKNINYGVIVSIQAPANISELPRSGIFNYSYKYKWFTAATAINKNRTKIYLALDRGETVLALDSNKWIKTPQKIAYLTVYGSGQYKGLLFSLGNGETPNTLGDNNDYKGFGNVTVPPQRQCKDLVSVPNSNKFKDKPLIIASKNSRNGSDGGIFRLCRQTVKKPYEVSFVTDEDLNEPRRGGEDEACGGQDCIERRHANESYGFMAFQQVVSPSVCQLFPGPVQTWKESKNGILTLNHSAKIMGAALIDSKRYVGMNVNDPTPDKEKDNCDGEECYSIGDNFELYAKENTGLETKDFNDNIYDIDNSKKEYWIDSLWVGPDQIVSFPRQTILHVKNLELNGNYSGLVANLCAAGANAKDCDNANPDDLIIYVHGNNGRVNISNGAFIRGLIYSQSNVDISSGAKNNSGIYGALTAPNVSIEGSSQSKYHGFIYGQSVCISSTPKYTLMLSPDMTSTLCDSKKITFSVNSTNSDTYNGTVSFTLTSASSGEWSTTENFTSGVTKFKSGSNTYLLPIFNNHASIWLRSDGVTTVNINASIENNTVTATGQYHFSMADDVYFSMTNKQENIIAGKTFNTTITAKICGVGNKAKTLTQYSGPKFLYLKTDYIQPTTPAFDLSKTQIKVEVITGSTIRATDYLDIKFDKGVSPKLTLKYREAGVIKWRVTDPNYTFEKIQSSGKKRRLTKSISINGVLGINSRPWTFAICPLTFNGKNKYDNASGTSNGGEAYTAAGKPFDIVAKPLIWQIGDPDSESAMVDVSEQIYCNRPVTQNFFAKDAPSLNTGVTLSNGGLDSPNNGQKGVFSSQPQTDNSQQEFNGLLIADNSWSEVGSLWVNANLTNYLGMTVNSSKRHIGRFFPAYFGLTHNQLTPAMTSFTYMGQPFPVHWTVNAFNQQGKALDNYDQFAETLTAKFGFVVKNNNGGDDKRLLLQDPVPEKWSHNTENSHSYINYQSNVTYARKGFLSMPLTTSPDGPDELWQLWLNLLNPSDNRPIDSPRLLTSELCSSKDGCTNPTVQKLISLRIGNINPMRYGRMALQDAAGDIGKSLTIPLRVEYWNGAEFVTNTDDSASTFDGANYCRQILIQEPVPHTPNNPTTSGAGTVNLGQPLLSQLMANPDGDFKQQIRFWQRLSAFTKPTQIAKTPKIYCKDSASNQPWLSYNWRGIGDEDPSATVTFGVYHGNNRIIYRGETNDAGQSIPYLNYQ
ncbi:DUF6701 domain-containing protein [Photobacterium carnosum]|uniref:DUF6701 domain-containing protein n=1 Tax=Photobacterium carnosum TaxID=2023717 RepID=UPI001E395577|nr:DUF6701 domain-containing protein [Photobacterium carnosum]MCD9538499.1 hypothetical protein [Photobacterium carnosum]MCF2162369.1 hypothetical protein [Photobacterium carnosum]